MSQIKLQREVAASVKLLWTEAYQNRRLPPICGPSPTTNWFDAIMMGSLLAERGYIKEAANLMIEGLVCAQHVRWAEIGSPSFQLTESAAAAFTLTEVDDLCWRDVQMPFDSFMVNMPSPSPIVFDTVDHETIGVTQVEVATCLTPTLSDGEINDWLREFNGLVERKVSSTEFATHIKRLKQKPALWVHAVSGNEVGDGMERRYVLPDSDATTIAGWLEGNAAHSYQSERSRHSMRLVCAVIASLCVWLDHSDGPHRWQRDLIRSNKAAGRGTTWTIGREIKLPKSMRDAARDLGKADKVPGAWELKSRLMVRGHTRNQAHGHGRQERRKQYIAPYWKGPEAAEVLPHLYKIGEEGLKK